MIGKKKFIENVNLKIDRLATFTPREPVIALVKEVIENCAVIAEKNTNTDGDYDVGEDIADTLRCLKESLTK